MRHGLDVATPRLAGAVDASVFENENGEYNGCTAGGGGGDGDGFSRRFSPRIAHGHGHGSSTKPDTPMSAVSEAGTCTFVVAVVCCAHTPYIIELYATPSHAPHLTPYVALTCQRYRAPPSDTIDTVNTADTLDSSMEVDADDMVEGEGSVRAAGEPITAMSLSAGDGDGDGDSDSAASSRAPSVLGMGSRTDTRSNSNTPTAAGTAAAAAAGGGGTSSSSSSNHFGTAAAAVDARPMEHSCLSDDKAADLAAAVVLQVVKHPGTLCVCVSFCVVVCMCDSHDFSTFVCASVISSPFSIVLPY